MEHNFQYFVLLCQKKLKKKIEIAVSFLRAWALLEISRNKQQLATTKQNLQAYKQDN